MLNIQNSQNSMTIELSKKLSLNAATDLIKLSIDGLLVPQDEVLFTFNSTDISDDDDRLFIGEFRVNEDLVIDGEDALKLQQMYLNWEDEKLNRTHVSYTLPSNRNSDKSNGVAIYNPYFLAAINKHSRNRNFDMLGFGRYLDEREFAFLHQYCAFHPAIRRFIATKDDYSIGGHITIPCHIFEMVIENGLAHIEGYRDHIRFKGIFESRNIEIVDDFEEDEDTTDLSNIKFLIEYDHVLDSPSIWNESLDFYSKTSSGGQLDLLNMPF